MDFALSFEERQVEETVSKCAKKKILPLKEKLESDGKLPEAFRKELDGDANGWLYVRTQVKMRCQWQSHTRKSESGQAQNSLESY